MKNGFLDRFTRYVGPSTWHPPLDPLLYPAPPEPPPQAPIPGLRPSRGPRIVVDQEAIDPLYFLYNAEAEPPEDVLLQQRDSLGKSAPIQSQPSPSESEPSGMDILFGEGWDVRPAAPEPLPPLPPLRIPGLDSVKVVVKQRPTSSSPSTGQAPSSAQKSAPSSQKQAPPPTGHALPGWVYSPPLAPLFGGMGGMMLGGLGAALESIIPGEPHNLLTMLAIPGLLGAGMGGTVGWVSRNPTDPVAAALMPYLGNPLWSAGVTGSTGALLGLLASALQGKLARQGVLRAMLLPGLLGAGLGGLSGFALRPRL